MENTVLDKQEFDNKIFGQTPKLENEMNQIDKQQLNEANMKKLDEKQPQEQNNTDYFSEYIKLFFANVVQTTQLKELYTDRENLLKKLSSMEKRTPNIGANGENWNNLSDLDKKKRKRKKKDEVERNFKCMIENCGKAYGSENSLNQHYKLKHEEIWQKLKLTCPELGEIKDGDEDDEISSSSSSDEKDQDEVKNDEVDSN